MPSVSIYRPPAARKLEQSANLSGIQAQETCPSVVSPSLEENKLKCVEEEKDSSLGGKKGDGEGISVFRNAITSIRTQNKVPKCKNVESTNRKNESVVESKTEEVVKGGVQNKQRRPDLQVYVPKGRRYATSCGNNGNSGDSKIAFGQGCEEKSVKDSEPEVNRRSECVQVFEIEDDEPTIVGAHSSEVAETESKTKEEVTSGDSRNGSSTLPNGDSENSSQGRGNSSQTVQGKKSAGVMKRSRGKVSQKGNKKRSSSEGVLNPDECDWESMFDDTGECLDPSLLEQLTSAVGEVSIEKPKSNYNEFKNKNLDMVADEFPHVIEIYNFPPEFQIQDLMTVFSQFKNSGFEIKWVDDTHALGIFSSSAVVSEVLSFYHPFVKTRLLKEGTTLSKMKARRSAEFLLPYKPRPDTCPALARRLVTGALGVRLSTTREEREAEKKLLTKAREKKRLEAKQKEDAWEGTFS